MCKRSPFFCQPYVCNPFCDIINFPTLNIFIVAFQIFLLLFLVGLSTMNVHTKMRHYFQLLTQYLIFIFFLMFEKLGWIFLLLEILLSYFSVIYLGYLPLFGISNFSRSLVISLNFLVFFECFFFFWKFLECFLFTFILIFNVFLLFSVFFLSF